MFGADTLLNDKAPSRAPLASHPAFGWIMIVWCVLLFGLATFVIANAFSSGTLLPIGLSILAAVLGAGCGYQFSRSVGANVPAITLPLRKQRMSNYDETDAVTGRAAAPIMSTQDLGSVSLDAPLESELQDDALVLEEGAVRDDTDQPSTYYEDPFAEDGLNGTPSPNDRHTGAALGRPQFSENELTFGALEDRPDDANLALDGLEEPAEADKEGAQDDALALDGFQMAEVDAEPAEEESLAPSERIAENLQEADIVSLKERDLEDLSLVQMVERFAVGLEGHRVARANDPSSRRMRPSDPRVAQAIRELPIGDLRKSGTDPAARAEAEQTEAALREALEKLQRMSDHA